MHRSVRLSIDEPLKVAGGSMAQGGVGAAGFHGREPMSLRGEKLWRDRRVDAGVEAVKTSVGRPNRHRLLRRAGRLQLVQADDAMLLTGKTGDAGCWGL
jgi:hypothetical protein